MIFDLPVDAASGYYVGIRGVKLETEDVLRSLQKQLEE